MSIQVCPNCHGHGGMTAGRETLAGSYWSPPEAVWLRCRTCKGTGRIEERARQEEPTSHRATGEALKPRPQGLNPAGI